MRFDSRLTVSGKPGAIQIESFADFLECPDQVASSFLTQEVFKEIARILIENFLQVVNEKSIYPDNKLY